jgi:hypothetical protein
MSNTVFDLREMAQSQPPIRSAIIDNFIQSLGETAGARFIAASRVSRRDRRVTELTAYSAVYLIILTLLPYLLNIPAEVTGYLDFFRIVLSIVILIAAIFHWASNNHAKAEQLHRSGLELNDLKREVEMRKDHLDLDDLDILRVRYENIIQKYTVDHDPSDVLRYQIEHKERYPLSGSLTAFVMGAENSVRQSAPRIVLVLISVIMVFSVLSLFGSYPARLPS